MIYADDNIHEALEKIASAEHEKTALSKQLLIRAAKAARHGEGQLGKAWLKAPTGSALEKFLVRAKRRRGAQTGVFETGVNRGSGSSYVRGFRADQASARAARDAEKLIGLKKSPKRAPMMPGYASASTVKMRKA